MGFFLAVSASLVGFVWLRARGRASAAGDLARLHASEQRLAALIEATSTIVWSLDPKGNALEPNPGWTDFTGQPSEAGLGQGWLEVVHPEDRGRLSAIFREAGKGPHPFRVEYRLRRADGAWAHVEVHGTPVLDDGGRLAGWFGASRDLTERRQLERQLELSSRLTALGTLAAGMAHEINNPLAYVLGNLTFIEERVRQFPDGGELSSALAEVRAGAERIRSVVDDIRQFSRTTADAEPEPVDLPALLRSALRMASAQLRSRATVVEELGPVPPLLGSANRLGQVFLNLLLNAAQAIPEGPPENNRVTVRLRARDADWVSVEVTDTGAGMAPDVQRRLFEPFFTTKPAGVGTGLGLSICHGIVEAHAGKIEVESEVGRGTTFRVLLPCRPGPAAVASPRREAAAANAQAGLRAWPSGA
ncbi:MAG: two-component system sensor histidine kinase NtrB [Deltaproteobacteria bacterium]